MKRCIFCGAKFYNINPKTETCRPLCTLAKRKGLRPSGMTTEKWFELSEELEGEK